jgi:hypothetical protein
MNKRFTGLAVAGALSFSGACSSGESPRAANNSASSDLPSVQPKSSASPEAAGAIKRAESAFEADAKTQHLRATALVGVCAVIAVNDGYYTVPNPIGLIMKDPTGPGELEVTAAFDSTTDKFIYGAALYFKDHFMTETADETYAGYPDEIDLVFDNAPVTAPAAQELTFSGHDHGFRTQNGLVVGTVAAEVTGNGTLKDYAGSPIAEQVCSSSISRLALDPTSPTNA